MYVLSQPEVVAGAGNRRDTGKTAELDGAGAGDLHVIHYLTKRTASRCNSWRDRRDRRAAGSFPFCREVPCFCRLAAPKRGCGKRRLQLAVWRMSETWNLCRPGVPFEELAVEQPSFAPKSDLGGFCPGRPGRSESEVRHANRRSHNSAQQGFTENKGPKPIAKSNPCRRRAILASISNHARPLGTPPDSPPVHCLVNTVGRRRQRRARWLVDNRILSGTPAAIFMPVGGPQGHAEFDIALPPSVFELCSPSSQSAPRTSRNRLCPHCHGPFLSSCHMSTH